VKTALPALTAAKLELYRAMLEAGLDEAQLAQRLGWPPKKIAHVFDACHLVRLEQLEAALGRRLVVTSDRRERRAASVSVSRLLERDPLQ
jgi:antitoxin HicB